MAAAADIARLSLVRRPRRLRRTEAIRRTVRETHLSAADFVLPVFVLDGDATEEPIRSMPGISRKNLNDTLADIRRASSLGVRMVALFPVIDASLKDAEGSNAAREDGLVQRAVRRIKAEVPDVCVITDIALDPFTSHGHDGIVAADGTTVLNDVTVAALCRMAVSHAAAGADMVAPSDMMDGRVGAIRRALDEAGFPDTGILAYSIKFASAFYGPFREAVGSAKAAGTTGLDKRTYQLDPANRREAIVESTLDEEEGADILMVKPAGAYLDILRELRDRTSLPIAAYQVSGEYAALMAAALNGWLDGDRVMMESLLAIKRAGADMIFTYFAIRAAEKLGEH